MTIDDAIDTASAPSTDVQEFDVVVVGAGISGIDAAYHLQTMSPDRSFVMLEARDDIGGTWDLFRYPGVRSDSDMHTLGFGWKPWVHPKAIADGPAIMEYLRETVAEHDIARHIRFHTRVRRADWDTDTARWTVHTVHASTGAPTVYRCNFLFMCSGYYRYSSGHRPDFPGEDRFEGTIVHPQQWPDDLDHSGKRVVVIGSGATAMTLVPAMTDRAEHVTMLQRSPTYVVSKPDEDAIAKTLHRVLPDKVAYRITRAKNAALQGFFYGRTRVAPEKVKKQLLDLARKELPEGYVEEHFTPSYDPWDQRMCLIPNKDLYRAISAGKASVVTDTIDTFTETGIRTSSGTVIPADIIVTATGLQLVTLGEVDFTVDGEPVDFHETWTYKGMGYSDVPNLISSFGYIAASWTLRADITCEYVCRLLNHMREIGADIVVPRLRPGDEDMPVRPWIDHFSSGYMQRSMHLLPKQGDRPPWVNTQSYREDKSLIVKAPVADGVLQFSRSRLGVMSR
jgi:monooxygenase